MKNKFWVVWNPKREAPIQRHVSHNQAKAEAKRLAGLTPGEEFYVLESVGMAKKNDVSFYVYPDSQILDLDGIPF